MGDRRAAREAYLAALQDEKVNDRNRTAEDQQPFRVVVPDGNSQPQPSQREKILEERRRQYLQKKAQQDGGPPKSGYEQESRLNLDGRNFSNAHEVSSGGRGFQATESQSRPDDPVNLSAWKREGYPSEYAYALAAGALDIKTKDKQEVGDFSAPKIENFRPVDRQLPHTGDFRSDPDPPTLPPMINTNNASPAWTASNMSTQVNEYASTGISALGVDPNDAKAAKRAKQAEYAQYLEAQQQMKSRAGDGRDAAAPTGISALGVDPNDAKAAKRAKQAEYAQYLEAQQQMKSRAGDGRDAAAPTGISALGVDPNDAKAAKRAKQAEYAQYLEAQQQMKSRAGDGRDAAAPTGISALGVDPNDAKAAKRAKQAEYAQYLEAQQQMKHQGVADDMHRNAEYNRQVSSTKSDGGGGYFGIPSLESEKEQKRAKQAEYLRALQEQQARDILMKDGANMNTNTHANKPAGSGQRQSGNGNGNGVDLDDGWTMGPMGMPVRRTLEVGNRRVQKAFNQIHEHSMSPTKQQQQQLLQLHSVGSLPGPASGPAYAVPSGCSSSGGTSFPFPQPFLPQNFNPPNPTQFPAQSYQHPQYQSQSQSQYAPFSPNRNPSAYPYSDMQSVSGPGAGYSTVNGMNSNSYNQNYAYPPEPQSQYNNFSQPGYGYQPSLGQGQGLPGVHMGVGAIPGPGIGAGAGVGVGAALGMGGGVFSDSSDERKAKEKFMKFELQRALDEQIRANAARVAAEKAQREKEELEEAQRLDNERRAIAEAFEKEAELAKQKAEEAHKAALARQVEEKRLQKLEEERKAKEAADRENERVRKEQELVQQREMEEIQREKQQQLKQQQQQQQEQQNAKNVERDYHLFSKANDNEVKAAIRSPEAVSGYGANDNNNNVNVNRRQRRGAPVEYLSDAQTSQAQTQIPEPRSTQSARSRAPGSGSGSESHAQKSVPSGRVQEGASGITGAGVGAGKGNLFDPQSPLPSPSGTRTRSLSRPQSHAHARADATRNKPLGEREEDRNARTNRSNSVVGGAGGGDADVFRRLQRDVEEARLEAQKYKQALLEKSNASANVDSVSPEKDRFGPGGRRGYLGGGELFRSGPPADSGIDDDNGNGNRAGDSEVFRLDRTLASDSRFVYPDGKVYQPPRAAGKQKQASAASAAPITGASPRLDLRGASLDGIAKWTPQDSTCPSPSTSLGYGYNYSYSSPGKPSKSTNAARSSPPSPSSPQKIAPNSPLQMLIQSISTARSSPQRWTLSPKKRQSGLAPTTATANAAGGGEGGGPQAGTVSGAGTTVTATGARPQSGSRRNLNSNRSSNSNLVSGNEEHPEVDHDALAVSASRLKSDKLFEQEQIGGKGEGEGEGDYLDSLLAKNRLRLSALSKVSNAAGQSHAAVVGDELQSLVSKFNSPAIAVSASASTSAMSGMSSEDGQRVNPRAAARASRNSAVIDSNGTGTGTDTGTGTGIAGSPARRSVGMRLSRAAAASSRALASSGSRGATEFAYDASVAPDGEVGQGQGQDLSMRGDSRLISIAPDRDSVRSSYSSPAKGTNAHASAGAGARWRSAVPIPRPSVTSASSYATNGAAIQAETTNGIADAFSGRSPLKLRPGSGRRSVAPDRSHSHSAYVRSDVRSSGAHPNISNDLDQSSFIDDDYSAYGL